MLLISFSNISIFKVISSIALFIAIIDVLIAVGLLSAKTDFHMLEELIQKVNENPYLRIEVRLKDGTSMLLKTYLKDNRADLINGDYEEIK